MKSMQKILSRPSLKPGAPVQVWINAGWREAVVLAVLADRALVEYTMPHGTTALAFVDAFDFIYFQSIAQCKRVIMRPCTYRLLLLPWLNAVITQSPLESLWQGRSCRGKVPSPRTILKHRV